MRKVLRYGVIGIILVLFLWTFWFLYKKSVRVPEVFPTEQATIVDIVKKTVAAGTITPRKEINIKSQVSGVVDELFVEAGQYVKKGQLLARIKIIPNMVSLNNAETNRNQAEISYNQAKMDYERYKKLYDEKVISQTEYIQYEIAFTKAKEQLQAAENNLELVREGAIAKGGRASNLVRSTVDGMILDIPVKEGSFVIESNTFNEGTTIVTIADMNDMIFLGKVDEAEVGKISQGTPVLISIGALPGKTFSAKIEFISPKGIEEDGAVKFEIKAALTLSKDQYIRSGYSANADIVLDKREKVLAIKESLIQYSKDSVYVEVEKTPIPEQKFEKRLVKLGVSDGIHAEVLSGVTDKDKIKVFLKKSN